MTHEETLTRVERLTIAMAAIGAPDIESSREPEVHPSVSVCAIRTACGQLLKAVDGVETYGEFLIMRAYINDCWNQIEAVSRYARDAADKD